MDLEQYHVSYLKLICGSFDNTTNCLSDKGRAAENGIRCNTDDSYVVIVSTDLSRHCSTVIDKINASAIAPSDNSTLVYPQIFVSKSPSLFTVDDSRAFSLPAGHGVRKLGIYASQCRIEVSLTCNIIGSCRRRIYRRYIKVNKLQ